MTRIAVRAELLRWARERAQLTPADLESRFPHLEAWEMGERQPTLKQLEAFAKATHAPIGFLLLPEPPEEVLPLPDFRTMPGRPVRRPSPDLIDMVLACQERQDWFRDHAIATKADAVTFVGSASLQTSVRDGADEIRRILAFDLDERRQFATWTEALRSFVLKAEAAGVLVMVSGIVMNNTHRKLDPNEFRGFALVDDLAPLVFVNGSDSKSAQMFTLAHELAHIWLGQSAISDSTPASQDQNRAESWCNAIAAEVLVPLERVREDLRRNESIEQTVARLVRSYKVSSLVILQRLRAVGRLTWPEFDAAYKREVDRLANLPRPSGGGDFYLATGARYSRRFARALIESTREGRTLYRDAFRMLGISRTETFNELGRNLAFGN